jgi:hypothetical protein
MAGMEGPFGVFRALGWDGTEFCAINESNDFQFTSECTVQLPTFMLLTCASSHRVIGTFRNQELKLRRLATSQQLSPVCEMSRVEYRP